ncbi:hypothetical protein SDIAM26S_04099 [Streptomyces diastaticus subsp. diastaticus]
MPVPTVAPSSRCIPATEASGPPTLTHPDTSPATASSAAIPTVSPYRRAVAPASSPTAADPPSAAIRSARAL